MKNVRVEFKFLITILIISLFTIGIAVGLTYYLYQKFYVDRQVEILRTHGNILVQEYFADEESFFHQIEWSEGRFEWEIIYTDNPMLLSGNLPFMTDIEHNLISFDERQTLLSGKELVFIRKHEKFNSDILAVVIPIIEQSKLNAAVFLYMPLSTVYEPFQSLKMIIFVLSLGLLAIIFIVARKITNQITEPIKQMTKVTQFIAAGHFTERIDLTQKDELGQLAKSLNRMAGKLEEVEHNRREFLANVSHELRTPISYMKGFCEAVEEGIVEPDQFIEIMRKETSRIERLVRDLLDLAQLEGDSYPMNPVPTSFAQLIIDVAERFEVALQQKQLSLDLNIDEEIIVDADPDRLAQVITNLLQNALQYSDEQGVIQIRLFQTDFIYFTITDYGEGIPKHELNRLSERFYRVNKARTRKDGGTGLGLAIVQQIVEKHSGTIQFDSVEGKGTTVTLILPRSIHHELEE